jgi:predicted GIY-YIG superfamily endonuclease
MAEGYTRTIPKEQPTTITSPKGTPAALQAARDRCKARGSGWVWDEATRTCTRVSNKPVGAGGSIDTEEKRQATRQVGDTERQKLMVQAGVETSAAKALEAKNREYEIKQIIEAERQRLIAEEAPERRELSPEISALESIPVIGGTFGVIKDRFQEIVLATVPEGEFKEQFKEALGVARPEELRTLGLTEIERLEIERGLSASEKFGALIEGIPVVGSLAGKYAGGLIETPSENAAQVKSNLLKEKRRMGSIETSVRLGVPPTTANEIIQDIENNVQRLESRLRLLINNSPELKFNSDLVNTYETEILSIREKAFQTKLNILSLTPATDENDIQILEQLYILQEEWGKNE